MSEHLKTARKSMKDKLARYLDKVEGPVDASGYVVPDFLNNSAKTGMRPVSRRQYKRGGKVKAECTEAEGKKTQHHAGRKPRKSGGSAQWADSYINRDQKEANKEREGIKHVGGFKRGGRTEKAGGGLMGPGLYGMQSEPTSSRMTKAAGLKCGGRAHKADGGSENAPLIEAPKGPYKTRGPENQPGKKDTYDDPYEKEVKTIPAPKDPYKTPGPVDQPGKKDSYNDPYSDEGPKFKKGGKVSMKKWEGSHKDLVEDKKLAKKHHMTFKDWEKSDLDKKHDKQQNMKGLKRGGEAGHPQGCRCDYCWGGRAKRASGGGNWIKEAIKSPGALHKSLGVSAGEKIPEKKILKAEHSSNPTLAKRARLAETLKGMPHKKRGGSLSVSDGELEGTRPTGGRLARKSGGRAKGKTNINIVIATGKDQQQPMGGLGPQPGMPQPPLGRPVPVPPPGGAPAAGAPMPMPVPMPMPAGAPAGGPPMGRKYGGRSNHKENRHHYKK